ncbi:MAG: T9SS type A sorting domain-containing protein [Salibacteraceae bacterium]
MKNIQYSFILTLFTTFLWGSVTHAQDRSKDPVVVSASLISSFNGLPIDDLVGFRWQNNAWQQVPIQIDERVWQKVEQPYDHPTDICLDPSERPEEWFVYNYADAVTYTGPDDNPGIDGDDELAFMQMDLGGKFTGSSCPANVLDQSILELEVRDPLNNNLEGYLYLFERANNSIDPSAGANYVTYNFGLINSVTSLGQYKTCEKNTKCSNNSRNFQCENSYVFTDEYRTEFESRWEETVLQIFAGNASGTDILDAHQGFVVPSTEIASYIQAGIPVKGGPCGRTEKTFSTFRGAIVTYKDGPVRAIRSVMGSNSGTYNQLTTTFTKYRVDYHLDFRVHNFLSSPCGGFGDVFDLSPAASNNMTYYNDVLPGGDLINGTPPSPALPNEAVRQWEFITGQHGSIAVAYQCETNMPYSLLTDKATVCAPTYIDAYAVNSYYDDNANNAKHTCTGDGQAIGSFGFRMSSDICFDRKYSKNTNNDCKESDREEFSLNRYHYYLAPNTPVAHASNYSLYAKNPLSVTVSSAITCDDNGGGGGSNLSVSLSAGAVSCNGGSDGSVTSSVSNGTTPYTYNWSNGASSPDLINVPANGYAVTVTDAVGATATGSAAVNEPAALLVSLSTNPSTNGQANGSATASAMGGTPNYTYNWSGPNGYTGSDGTITNLLQGTYQVTVTDQNNCTATGSALVEDNTSGGGCSYNTFDSEDFESGFGIWQSGGSNTTLATPSSSSTQVVQIRNGTSTSRLTASGLNFSSYDQIQVNFDFGSQSFDNGKSFELQISIGGSAFTTIATYTAGTDFPANSNGQSETATFAQSGGLGNNVSLRFKSNASQSNDRLFLDNVTIEGCNSGSLRRWLSHSAGLKPTLTLAPNPAKDLVLAQFQSSTVEGIAEVWITDLQGRSVARQMWQLMPGDNRLPLQINEIPAGIYLVNLQLPDGSHQSRKLILLDR